MFLFHRCPCLSLGISPDYAYSDHGEFYIFIGDRVSFDSANVVTVYHWLFYTFAGNVIVAIGVGYLLSREWESFDFYSGYLASTVPCLFSGKREFG